MNKVTPSATLWFREWMVYPLVALVAVLVKVWVWQLWKAHLGIPFQYTGDAAFTGAIIKGMVENGHLWVNKSLGAPGAMSLLDYPSADLIHYGAMKFLSLFQGNWAVAMNGYYLLGYPLAAVTATWAMRRLGLSRLSSAGMGVLYAFLPYHLFRIEAHLFLSQYYLVPLVAALALELCGKRPPLVDMDSTPPRLLSLRSRSIWVPIVICLLAGSSGIYYVFFGVFFLLVGGIVGWREHSQRVRLYAAGLLIAAMLVSSAVNLAPFVVHRLSAGPNPTVAGRNPAEAEIFALRITQLLLPTTGHRIPLFAAIRADYSANAATTMGSWTLSESNYVALGAVASLGFVFLIWVLIFGLGRPEPPGGQDAVRHASRLNIAGLLLATMGGFGAVLALGFTQIRAYNRIVVFLAFFALLAVGWVLDRVCARLAPSWRAAVLCGLVVAVTAVGLADQIPVVGVDYEGQSAQWRSTRLFVHNMEQQLPKGAMVLQLPYVPFPENPPVVGMLDYDHFLPYLVSTKIHWSYGAVKGREDAKWLSRTSALPAAEMVATLKRKGFSGIWVDREGYEDRGAAITDAIAATGAQPYGSADGRYVFILLPK